MDPTALYYALSTIAQCAAALAALIGFLGLWRLDRLRNEESLIEQRIIEVFLHRLAPPKWQSMGTTILLEQARFLATHARSDSKGDYTPDLELRFKRWFARLDDTLPPEQRWLMRVLRVFLFVTLVVASPLPSLG